MDRAGMFLGKFITFHGHTHMMRKIYRLVLKTFNMVTN